MPASSAHNGGIPPVDAGELRAAIEAQVEARTALQSIVTQLATVSGILTAINLASTKIVERLEHIPTTAESMEEHKTGRHRTVEESGKILVALRDSTDRILEALEQSPTHRSTRKLDRRR